MDLGKLLLNPKVYPEKVRKIELIQTHISWVFLTEKYAFKVKKPVNFGFVDFSTLPKRKFYCQRELELNRRLSPEIYLKVLPITKEKEGIKIAGKGKIIDWILLMRRLPQERMMKELLKRGEITKSILRKLAKILANFHRKTKSSEVKKKYKSLKIIKFNWEENFWLVKKFISQTILKKDFDFIKNKVFGFLLKNKGLFKKRAKEGKIKWCHGDLHSENIFVINNEIYFIDCIEFNERFACQDVASDVAFLAMDLDFAKREKLANYFIKNYLKYRGDFEMLKLLNFYKCYRAFVRGKVNSLKGDERGIPKSKRKKLFLEAAKYFELSQKYAQNL